MTLTSANTMNAGLTVRVRDGRRLGYAEYGDPAGFPVMFFHGTPGSRLKGSICADAAAGAGARLICPERPGYGLSDPKRGRRLLDWPDDVVDLAAGLGVDRFAVVGTSGGGPHTVACAYKIPERLTAVAILAGGKATRMGGRPKSFVTVGGRHIIDRQLDVLRPRYDELFIVANDPVPYEAVGLPIYPDVVWSGSPLAGILTAVERARAPRVIVLACDMPHITAEALALLEQWEDEDVVIPVARGRHEPLFARYGKACAAPIRARVAAGERKATCFHADVRVGELGEDELRRVDPALRFLANCNTPEDLL
jgi:molybdopterin-guanine dinucleotide biosynthesis protein A